MSPPRGAGRNAAEERPGRYSDLIRSQVGYRAPDIGAVTLDGFATRRLESFQGRNVLLSARAVTRQASHVFGLIVTRASTIATSRRIVGASPCTCPPLIRIISFGGDAAA